MIKEALRLLVVDDELSLLTPLAKYWRENYGCQFDTASNATEALAQLKQNQGDYHVVLIDDLLVPQPGHEPEPLGLILTGKIKTRYPAIEIIVFTDQGMASALDTMRAGAYRYLTKPLNFEELGILIQMAAEHSHLRAIAHEKKILERFMETSAALLSGQDLTETLNIILQGIQSIGFDRVRLYLLAADGRAMESIAQAGMDVELADLKLWLDDDDYMQAIVNEPRPYIFERAAGAALPYEKELAKKNVNQWACVPLVLEGQIIGKLSMDNKFSQRPITEAELGPIGLFASQAAAAIQQARLRANELTAIKQAEQRARKLEAIQRVSTTLSSTLEIEKVLESVCQAAVNLVEADHSGLVLFHEPDCEFGCVAAEYPDRGTLGQKIQVRGVPFEERLIATKKPVVLPEITDTVGLGPVADILRQFDICSILIVPVILKEQIIGSFSLDAIGQTRLFSQTEVELCRTFADQVAIAVGNARTYEAVKGYAERLNVLYKISDYIQDSEDLDKILHVVLTGVTAGYGLSFNRAALLLLDEGGAYLKGRLGIGHINEAKAKAAWAADTAGQLFNFDGYLAALEQNHLPPTPIDERIRNLTLPIDFGKGDIFSHTILNGNYQLVAKARLAELPKIFIETFKPESPFIVVPLLARDEPIGLLVADNKFTQAEPTSTEIEALLMFANTAAIAIDNTRLLQETRVATERLSSFFEASNALVSSFEPEQVLQDILGLACVAANANGASLILIDQLGQAEYLINVGADEKVDIKHVVRSDGLSIKVLRSGQYEVIENASQERYRVNPSVFWRRIEAALCLPVSVEGQRIGVMWIHYEQPRRFGEAEIKALQLYVNQAAIAFDSARRMKELKYMRQAAEALAGVAELQEVLVQIVHSSKEVLQANSTAIWSYDQVREKFNIDSSVADGIPLELWQKFQKGEARHGQTTQVIMERGWVGVENIDDVETYSFLGEPTLDLLQEVGAYSFQGIALNVGREKFGVLFVNYNRPRKFSEKERQTAKTFANHAALALKNAKLLNQLRKLHDTAQIVARVTLLEDLEHTLNLLVEATISVLGCDATVLFTYDQNSQKLGHPPIVTGVNHPEKTRGFKNVPSDSFVFNLLNRTEPYIAEQAPTDPILADRRFLKEEGIRSCVVIPLQVGGQKVGIMFVNYRQFHHFTTEQVKHIELFASQAAVAIRNAQLFEEAQTKARLLRMAAQVARRATAILETDKLLVETGRLISDSFGFYHTGVFLLGSKKGSVELQVVYPNNDAYLKPGHKLSIGQGIVGQVAQLGQAHLAPDVTCDPHYIPTLPLTRAEMAFPLIARGEVIGVLDAQSTKVGDWHSEDIATLQIMADQLANAIFNAQLYQQVNRRLADSNILRDVAVLLAGTSELSEVLDVVLMEAMRLTDTNEGVVLFWDAETEAIRQGFKVDMFNSLQYYQPFTRSNGITRRIIEQRKPLFIGDIKRSYEANPLLLQQGYRAILGVPLLSRDHGIGVLYVRSKTPRQFTDQQVRLLEILASHVAVAIDRARQFEDMKKIKGYIGSHTATDWIRMTSTTWGHSIRREVGTARGHVALIRALLSQDQLTDEIQEQLEQLDQTINGIKDIPVTAPLSYEDAINSVKINATLKTYLERRWRQSRYQSVELELNLQPGLDDRATVRASQEWLRRGLELIIDNSVYAMEQAELADKQIIITTQLIETNVKICIQDTGCGIPQAVQSKIFKQPILKPEGSKGSGIGLMLARTIFQTYLGEVELKSTGPRGTIMQVTLPVEDSLSQLTEVRTSSK